MRRGDTPSHYEGRGLLETPLNYSEKQPFTKVAMRLSAPSLSLSPLVLLSPLILFPNAARAPKMQQAETPG